MDITELVIGVAQSPWVYALVFAVSTIDGFFPPVPSESVVVALAAIALSAGSPDLMALMAVSAMGAALGDSIAYWLGRKIGVERFAWMHRPRVAKAIVWARAGLQKRSAVVLLTARYIPIGRVAVNATAGATKFPYKRFLPLSLLAAVMWGVYSVAIGSLAGAWLHDNPLLGAAVAIVFAIALGFLVDYVLATISKKRAARRDGE